MPDDAARLARTMWTWYERIHSVTYFTPETRAAFEAVGLRGFWRSYFAGRAAPLGAVDAAPVIASFFSFAPPVVTRALPQVWSLASPEQALQARWAAASAVLQRLLAGQEGAVTEAAELLERATADLDCAGRVLAAANAALPRPELPGSQQPFVRLWQATTLLREHRGDAHVATLVAADVTGLEAVVWRAALDVPREWLQPARGWTDEQWEATRRRLVDRGWLTPAGEPTDAGRAHHDAVEAATDRAAAAPWRTLTPAELDRLATLLQPLALECDAALPHLNAIGLPAVAAAR